MEEYFEQKDIPGTDGWYQATTHGKIWSCRRGRFLKPQKHVHNGYMYVNTNGMNTVHRLVALTWLEKPEGKNYVDHINEIRDDNRVENLRWVDNSTNLHNSSKTKGYSFDKRRGKYSVEFMLNGVRKFYGYYDTKEDARTKYLEVKRTLLNE